MEPLSRRRFFRGGAAVMAGAALGGVACAPADPGRVPGDLSQLHQASFAAEVGSRFQLVSGPAPFTELTLIEVDDFAARQPQRQQGELFAAVFLGPADVALPQELYRLEHPRLGALSLLIVPVGRREEGRLYEAVFNRQTGPGRG